MARYKEKKDEADVLTGVNVNDGTHWKYLVGQFIPKAPGNRDWDEYLEWAGENTVDPADTYDFEPRMRSERDGLVSETNGHFFRHIRQRDEQGMDNTARTAASDALSDAEFTTLMTYIKDLADMPGDIASESEVGAHGSYETPVWPTKPSFL